MKAAIKVIPRFYPIREDDFYGKFPAIQNKVLTHKK
jgi:hypothetical protein